MKIFILFYIYILLTITTSIDNSDIIFVFEHARHGARSPLFADGNTKYEDHFGTKWEGASLLTNVGKRTHYAIGIHNRIKYNNLINFTKFNYSEIEIYSTNSPRVIQSIQAELLAMYTPGTLEQLSDEELSMAEPPINNLSSVVIEELEKLDHSTIVNDINVFPIRFSSPTKTRLNEPENCPYMSQYQAQLEKDVQNEIDVFLEKYDQKYGEQLQRYFNFSNRDFMRDFNFIELIMADEYLSNYFNGNNFSDFVAETNIDIHDFFNYTAESKNIYVLHMNLDEKTGVMAASPTMRDVINYMEKIINNVPRSPKMVIHGGHDTTVNYILYFMQYAFHIPIEYIPFAANVYFELHKNNSGENQYYVEYIYDGKSMMKIDYNDFKNKVIEALWSEEEIKHFCYKTEDEKPDNNSELDKYKTYSLVCLILMIIFFISTICFLALFIIFYKKSKNMGSPPDNSIQMINIIKDQI